MQRRTNDNTHIDKIRQNVETTKVFTPNLTDNLSVIVARRQLVIPTINSMSNENKFISLQIKEIAGQMTKVGSLGEYLAKQNKTLRNHYYNRFNDLQNILQTFKINTNETTNDISQQIHLLKAANLEIFNSIKANDEFLSQLNQSMIKLDTDTSATKQSNMDSQLEILNSIKARLSNKLNENSVRELTSLHEKLSISQKSLLDQVLELTIEIGQLWKHNNRRIHKNIQTNYSNKNEKLEYKNNIVMALKTLKTLEQQKQELQSALTKINGIREQFKATNDQLIQKAMQLRYNEEQLNIKLNDSNSIISNTHHTLSTHKINMNELEVQRMKTSDAKNALQNKIKSQYKSLSKRNKKNQQDYQQTQQNYNQQIKAIKQKIRKCDKQANTEMHTLRQQIEGAQRNQENLAVEYNHIENDCMDYKEILEKMENPIAQIQRGEMLLNINKNRPTMKNLINQC